MSAPITLALESPLVDQIQAFAQTGAVPRFSLQGITYQGLKEWTENLDNKGSVITIDDFGDQDVELTLSKVKFDTFSDRDLMQLSQSMQTDYIVTSLLLMKCPIDEVFSNYFFSALATNGTLTKLTLSGCGVDDDATADIAALLTQNKVLTSLDLSVNQIGPAGAATIAKAIKDNSSIQHLKMSDNQILVDGLQHFYDVVSEMDVRCGLVSLQVANCFPELQIANTNMQRSFAELFDELSSKPGSVLEYIEIGDTKRHSKQKKQVVKKSEVFKLKCDNSGITVYTMPGEVSLKSGPMWSWTQQAKDVAIVIKNKIFKKASKDKVRVQFDPQHVYIMIGDQVLMSEELYGLIIPKACLWTAGDGIMTLLLEKATKEFWPELANTGTGPMLQDA